MRHFTILNNKAGSFSKRETEKIHHILHSGYDNLEGKFLITPTIPYLEEILEEYKDYNPDILGMGGGDGTAPRILTSIQKIWEKIPPYIAAYAFGTMNNWATPFGLNDGLIDKAKKAVGRGETKSIILAKYIAECAKDNKPLRTAKMGLLELNGENGFNFGLGIVPKLLWGYYGHTIEQYIHLEEKLKISNPHRYQQIYEQILAEKNVLNDIIEIIPNGHLIKKTGLITTATIGFNAIWHSLRINSKENKFYANKIEGSIYLDDKKLDLPEQPINIYCATYEQAYLGLPWFMPYPSPEARSCEGKMQVILTFGNPLDVVLLVPDLFRAKHPKNNSYYMASKLEVRLDQPGIAQLDAEYKFGDRFVLQHDKTLNFIAPFGN